MGERKVLNKYFPPDFDPAKLPKGTRQKGYQMKVRMMLPMSVRCQTCGNYMYAGTKFNTRMEDVERERYLGMKVFRFYFRCTNCAAEFLLKTDPKNSDYVVEAGASRNYEPWRESERVQAEAELAREEEEMGNAMKVLENRTDDSRRELDLMATIDELRSLKAQQGKITLEEALAALKQNVESEQAAGGEGAGASGTAEGEGGEEEEKAVEDFLARQAAFLTKRLRDSSSDDDDKEPAAATDRDATGAEAANREPGQAAVAEAATGSAGAAETAAGASASKPEAESRTAPAAPKPRGALGLLGKVKVGKRKTEEPLPAREQGLAEGSGAKRAMTGAAAEEAGPAAGLLPIGYGSSESE